MKITDKDVVELIGADRDSAVVGQFVKFNELSDIYIDPPNRLYVGSKSKGVDFLFEENVLTSIQIFLVESVEHNSFIGELPFGIFCGMSQDAAHNAIGLPEEFDDFDSKFAVFDGKCKLIIDFDDDLRAKLVQFVYMG